MPKMSPESAVRPKAKINTRASSATVSNRGMFAGLNETKIRMPPKANSTPAIPPNAARRQLSVRNCRTRREFSAPTAERTAISFCRAAERASDM